MKFALIDASWWLHRAYYAVPLAQTSDGTPCNAVYGFCGSLIKLLAGSGMTLTHVAAVFDARRRGTFRSQLYPDYKAKRKDLTADLAIQFRMARDACAAFGVSVVEHQEFEADDLIATLAREASDRLAGVYIVSIDKDLMQVVSDRVVMVDADGVIIGPAEVFGKLGVRPDQVPDYLALTGDVVDNVPGVPGIGPIYAAGLLRKHGTVPKLLSVDPTDRSEMLVHKHSDTVLLSRRLTKLRQHCEIDVPLDGLTWSEFPETAGPFLRQLGFLDLLPRVPHPA